MDQKIMKALARKTDDAFEKEYEELNEVGKGFSPQLDAKLLEAAKFKPIASLYFRCLKTMRIIP